MKLKWINHVLIAGSVTAVYDVRLVPLTIIGATAPDWIGMGVEGAVGRSDGQTSRLSIPMRTGRCFMPG